MNQGNVKIKRVRLIKKMKKKKGKKKMFIDRFPQDERGLPIIKLNLRGVEFYPVNEKGMPLLPKEWLNEE